MVSGKDCIGAILNETRKMDGLLRKQQRLVTEIEECRYRIAQLHIGADAYQKSRDEDIANLREELDEAMEDISQRAGLSGS